MFEGNEIRGLQQNSQTESRWAQLARSGKKVMQFLSEGRYVANSEGDFLWWASGALRRKIHFPVKFLNNFINAEKERA